MPQLPPRTEVEDRPKSLVREVTADDWASARESLEMGDGEPMIAILLRLEVGAGMVDVFALALKEAVRLEGIIAADPGRQFVERLSEELSVLARAAPVTLDEVQAITTRRLEATKEKHQAEIAVGNADHARNSLASLHEYFGELFATGKKSRHCLGWLSPAVAAALTARDIDPFQASWLDYRREVQPLDQRRRVRAAGFNRR